ncbi:MAG: transposase [Candidatus Pacebacteria bacterium]|jgi:transposase-like protein|nr:transposase [Candidatus Paceibacterota bacterium]
MRTKTYSDLEKEQLVKEVKDCGSLTLVCKKHNVPTSTAHTWLKKKKIQKSLKSQDSVHKLKKQIADHELKIKILEDLLKKTNHAWLGD